MKDRFRAKPDKKYCPKNWQAMNDRADDQIAPTGAARSIDDLQRWAFATANIAQNGHRSNEVQIVERIQFRYSNSDASGALTQNTSKESYKLKDSEQSGTATKPATVKRKHATSPTAALKYGELYMNDTTEGDTRQAKRHRKDEKESRVDEDDTYAQSSEWSFPSEDEMETTKARAYIEID
ncbi:hypothetical protein EKO04_008182 [Ascochyta lentis]|uniref:Uncharacterized protein n=1 Tax=Ascochyta lentis TaxID=205686 RepID=A0A8H7MHW7_9PLEO|nr:hypothetical protein EKO04_008182 [Ascochyta lentis]